MHSRRELVPLVLPAKGPEDRKSPAGVEVSAVTGKAAHEPGTCYRALQVLVASLPVGKEARRVTRPPPSATRAGATAAARWGGALGGVAGGIATGAVWR
jgi:hypothetical protein